MSSAVLYHGVNIANATFPRPATLDAVVPTRCIETLFNLATHRMAGRTAQGGKYHALVRLVDVFSLLTHGAEDWHACIAGGWVCVVESGSSSTGDIAECMDNDAFELTCACVAGSGGMNDDEMIFRVLGITSDDLRRSAIEIRVAIAIADLMIIDVMHEKERPLTIQGAEQWFQIAMKHLHPHSSLRQRLQQDLEVIRRRFSQA